MSARERVTNMTKDKLIGSIEAGRNREIRVIIQQYRDREYLNIRTYIQNKDGEWIPTKKGIMLDTELAPELEALVHKANSET